jgi:hypothetical protein
VDIAGRIGEVYLELYELDLEDEAAIVGFANSYGTPSGQLVHLALGGHSWFSSLFAPAADLQVWKTLVAGDPDCDESVDPIRRPDLTTLTSFRFAARVLRDLTDAWRIVSADPNLDAEAHRWQLDYPVPGESARSAEFALVLLAYGLTSLLGPFRPFVTATGSPPEEPPPGESEERGDELHRIRSAGVHTAAARSHAFAHLAQFCALELFNHIAASEVYRRCENETCRRVFVRQYGRAEHGQTRREGVMYCTYHCAQAQAQRNYRRRRRARTRRDSSAAERPARRR